MYLDENDLKKALENENNESIINLTISEIKSEKNDILQKLQLGKEDLKDNLKKLKEISIPIGPKDTVFVFRQNNTDYWGRVYLSQCNKKKYIFFLSNLFAEGRGYIFGYVTRVP